MELQRRTKILIEGDSRLLSEFSEQINENYAIHIEKSVAQSLVMAKARDAKTFQPFYIGEVMITVCTVSINGVFGFGAIMGENPSRAYELAVADAAFRAGLPETEALIPKLLKEENQIEKRHQEELALSLRTKVNFSDMEGPNDKH